jgi:hypothetical protein
MLTYFNNTLPYNAYYSTEFVFTTMDSLAVYDPPVKINDVDTLVRILFLVSAVISIGVSYSTRQSFLEKKKCDDEVRALLILEAIRSSKEKLAETNESDYLDIVVPRLDSMEQRVQNMANDLVLLSKLCPQMSDRTITMGIANATWPIPSIYHGDTVTLQYSLVDLITNEVIRECQVEYTCLSVSTYLNPNTDIKILAGTKIVVTKATRASRGIRDITGGFDMTTDAKAALETTIVKSLR